MVPNYTEAWYGKGLALIKKADSDDSEYRQIVFEDNDGKEDKNNIYYRDAVKGYNEAIRCFDTVTQLNPNHIDAWYYKGYALDYVGKVDKAIKSYDKVLGLDPDHKDAWGNKGFALVELGKYDEAAKSYDEFLRHEEPGLYPSAWCMIAEELTTLGRTTEANAAHAKGGCDD